MAELVHSVSEIGLLQPVVVRRVADVDRRLDDVRAGVCGTGIFIWNVSGEMEGESCA